MLVVRSESPSVNQNFANADKLGCLLLLLLLLKTCDYGSISPNATRPPNMQLEKFRFK